MQELHKIDLSTHLREDLNNIIPSSVRCDLIMQAFMSLKDDYSPDVVYVNSVTYSKLSKYAYKALIFYKEVKKQNNNEYDQFVIKICDMPIVVDNSLDDFIVCFNTKGYIDLG